MKLPQISLASMLTFTIALAAPAPFVLQAWKEPDPVGRVLVFMLLVAFAFTVASWVEHLVRLGD